MKRNRLICLSLAMAMAIGCSVPSITHATGVGGNSVEDITIQDVSDDGIEICNVNAAVSSTFCVSIPKTIQLDSASKSATYKVTCSGDFAANKRVTVVPDANFTLRSAGKADVTATVTQDKTVWTYDDHTEGVGTITADNLTAGDWKGKFNFAVTFEDVECPEDMHKWEYQTGEVEVQTKVKDERDEYVPERTEEVTEGVVICSCGAEFPPSVYGSVDEALEACFEHTFDNWDKGILTCQNYHVESRKVTITHPAETIHHEAEYKTETVVKNIGRTCSICHKYEELPE